MQDLSATFRKKQRVYMESESLFLFDFMFVFAFVFVVRWARVRDMCALLDAISRPSFTPESGVELKLAGFRFSLCLTRA